MRRVFTTASGHLHTALSPWSLLCRETQKGEKQTWTETRRRSEEQPAAHVPHRITCWGTPACARIWIIHTHFLPPPPPPPPPLHYPPMDVALVHKGRSHDTTCQGQVVSRSQWNRLTKVGRALTVSRHWWWLIGGGMILLCDVSRRPESCL